jgi:hypothetical protein
MNGYDRVSSKHFNIWLDNAGTGYLLSTGEASKDGKTMTFKGSSKDPMANQMMHYRMVQTITGDNTFTFTMYQNPEGKPETKAMEMLYTRGTKSASK